MQAGGLLGAFSCWMAIWGIRHLNQVTMTSKALAAEVALGHVGIIFGWEVSPRLARNNADWYHLLDLAAIFSTLIADVEGL